MADGSRGQLQPQACSGCLRGQCKCGALACRAPGPSEPFQGSLAEVQCKPGPDLVQELVLLG